MIRPITIKISCRLKKSFIQGKNDKGVPDSMVSLLTFFVGYFQGLKRCFRIFSATYLPSHLFWLKNA